MKSKVTVFFVAFLLVTVVFSIAFTDTVSASGGEWENDNDEAIWFRPANTKEKNYNYNYTDTVVEEQLKVYDSTSDLLTQYYDSEMSLTAHVDSLMSDETKNTINLHITATGAYRWNETSQVSINDDHEGLLNHIAHIGTRDSFIEAQLIDYDGYNDDQFDVNVEQERTSAVNFTEGDDDGGTKEPSVWQKHAGDAALLAANAAKVNPKVLLAVSAGSLIWDAVDGLTETPSYDAPEDSTSGSGLYDKVRQTWRHREDWPWDFDQPLERAHVVSKRVQVNVYRDNHPLPDSATLEVSAKNILAALNHDGDITGGPIDGVEGAEASVEIPIRNAEPELDEDEITVEYDEPVKTSDSRYSDCIRPEIEIGKGFIDNPAGCEKAEYNVTVKYSIDEEDWKELTTETMTITDSAELNPYIEIDDEEPEGEMYLEFHVSTKDEYGAWMQELDKDVNFDWVQCDYRLDLEKFEIESDHMESYSITTHDDSFTWSESIHVIMEYPDKYGEQFDETFIRIDWGNGEIVEHYICDWDPGEGVFDDTVENEYEFPEEGSYSYTVEIEIYTDNLWRDIKMFHLSIDYEEQGMRCPVCGGPFGECTCGGPMSTEPDATLEREEYEHHLEEGMISLELFLALSREDLEHIRMRSELTRVEEGWLITYEGEEKYGIELEEKKLAIYALDGEPC